MFDSDIKTFKKKVKDHFKNSHNYTAFTYPRPILKEIEAKSRLFFRLSDGEGALLGVGDRFWHTYRNSDKLARQLASRLAG